ncbi:metal ABC transporter ATP-binding protein [cf. Phormidesmis sp. LEGE 11477]|uniref:metal ABC transporter ATP-binding protein n=1 Tax=cf. Phormidesmis sp. LEGE 11477 TaxID=1828680 RepID=UPI001880744C|nr:metal ABC transporter ATP-binding protein [cf. Phormidesmis sp. LEGE 11477]
MNISKTPVLSVDQLTVRRGQQLALQAVSFSLEAGTDVAIIGPNGAGKSTLVQSILGIVSREQGTVQLLGQPLSTKKALPAAVRHQVAYLPQNFLVDRRLPLTVTELVALGWDKLGIQLPWAKAKARKLAVQQALARVEASHLGRKFISELSGGETKRILLAYCLVRSRQLLILDEAPAGLDVRSEADFYQLLYELKAEQGWTILQVSHDLDMVRKHCDRVICLNRRLMCQGVPETALAPENLTATYGPEFVRYRHNRHAC